MNLIGRVKSLSFAEIILYLSFVFVGTFHVYLACLLSTALVVWLFVKAVRSGKLVFKNNLTFVFISVLISAYAIVSLWAIDSGSAVFGFFKFLPLLLYSLVLMQEEGGKEKILNHLPYFLAASTVISVGLMYIPSLQSYFAVSGRLSGFIQYPNSFAIVLLVGELLLITKDKPKWFDYICILVLLFGILYTGSRTVFVLAGISNLVALFVTKNKVVRFVALGLIAASIALVLLYCLITNNFSVITRYLNISTTQSTFVGRMLYAHDALPVILSHPFGLGYLGYYFIQQSIQTGVYSIMFIHNDFLQMLLDVGWVPFLLFAAVIISTLINKKVPLRYKLAMTTLLVHCGFDFNLQYVAIFMILLLFLEPKPFKREKISFLKLGKVAAASALTLTVGLCFYFGGAQALERFQRYDLSAKWYNHNTTCDIQLMKAAPTTSEALPIAERVLKRNSHVALAYSVQGRAAYEEGDFGNVIKYKRIAIDTAPFSYSEYWDLGRMLVNGIKLYTEAGDIKSADICKEELLRLSKALPNTKHLLSEYGEAIDHQPVYYFPDDLNKAINELKGVG